MHPHRQKQQQRARRREQRLQGTSTAAQSVVPGSTPSQYQNFYTYLVGDAKTSNCNVTEQNSLAIDSQTVRRKANEPQLIQIPYGPRSDGVILSSFPIWNQQVPSGVGVQEYSRTLSSECVINYKDGSALRAGFSFHKPSCRCQECLDGVCSTSANLRPTYTDNVQVPGSAVVPSRKQIFVEQTSLPSRDSTAFQPCASNFHIPKNDTCIVQHSTVSNPSDHVEGQYVVVSKTTGLNNIENVAIDSRIMNLGGNTRGFEIQSGAVTSKTPRLGNESYVAEKNNISDPIKGQYVAVSKPVDISNLVYVAVDSQMMGHPGGSVQEPESLSDVCKALSLSQNLYVTSQPNVSHPLVCSEGQYVAVSKPTALTNMKNIAIDSVVASICGTGHQTMPNSYNTSSLSHKTCVEVQSYVPEPSNLMKPQYVAIDSRVINPPIVSVKGLQLTSKVPICDKLPVPETQTFHSSIPKASVICFPGSNTFRPGISNPVDTGHTYSDECSDKDSFIQSGVMTAPNVQNNRFSVIKLASSSPSHDTNSLVESVVVKSECMSDVYNNIQCDMSKSNIHNHVDIIMDQTEVFNFDEGQKLEKLTSKNPSELASDNPTGINNGNDESVIGHQLSDNNNQTSNKEAVNKPFKCTSCDKSFSSSVRLQKHNRIHDGTALQCNVCDKYFFSNFALHMHMYSHNTNKVGAFFCKVCGKSFPSPSDLSNHESCHKVATFRCHTCGESFGSRSESVKHSRTHRLRRKGGIFTCRVCCERFCSRSEMVKHSRTHCPPTLNTVEVYSSEDKTMDIRDSYKCDRCRHKFNSSSALSEHVLLCGEQLFACAGCKKRFGSKPELEQHMVIHEASSVPAGESNLTTRSDDTLVESQSTKKLLKCVLCRTFFETKHKLALHLMEHKDTRYYKCTHCSRQLTTKHGLESHLATHSTQKSHTCKECNLKFSSHQRLKIHLKNHSGRKSFHCNICRKGFMTGEGLDRHLENHKRKFSCVECDLVFNVEQELKEHILQHTDPLLLDGEEPSNIDANSEESRECTTCNRKFPSLHALSIHCAKSKHSGPLHMQEEVAMHSLQKKSKKLLGYHSESISFHCTICRDVFTTSVAFEMHMKMHNKHFSVTDCSSSLPKEKVDLDLEVENNEAKEILVTEGKHQEQNVEENQSTSFKCGQCNRLFTTKRGLDLHVIGHYSHKLFRCKECNMWFKSQRKLKTHTRLHEMEYDQPEKLSQDCMEMHNCKECNMIFVSQQALEEHEIEHQESDSTTGNECSTKEGEARNYECLLCVKQFSTRLGLDRHTSVHEHRKKFTCKRCFAHFKAFNMFKIHMDVHLGTGTLTDIEQLQIPLEVPKEVHRCTKCDLTFKSGQALQEHKLIHLDPTSESPETDQARLKCYECIPCGKKFYNRYSYSSHYGTSIHKKPSCKKCKLRFKSKKEFKLHMQNHHGSRTLQNTEQLKNTLQNPNKDYNSVKCSAIFQSEQTLHGHQTEHSDFDSFVGGGEGQHSMEKISDNKPFVCLNCDKPFATRRGLNLHTVTDCSRQLITCKQCEASFISFTEYKIHQGQHAIPMEIPVHNLKAKTHTVNRCEKCSMVFESMQALHQHKIEHKESDRTSKSEELREASQENDKTESFECLLCNKEFPSKRGMNIHNARCHGIYVQYPSVDSDPMTVETHWIPSYDVMTEERKDTTESPDEGSHLQCTTKPRESGQNSENEKLQESELLKCYECFHCSKEFTSERELNVHSCSHQTRKLNTSNEGEIIPIMSHLTSSIESVTEERSETVGELGESSFLNTNSMESDQDSDNETLVETSKESEKAELHECQVCNKLFSTKRSMNHHISILHGFPVLNTSCGSETIAGEKLELFQCSHCPKQYKTKSGLQYHSGKHTKRKTTHRCMECNKVFPSEQKLKVHEVSHFELKTFHCNICRKGFSTGHGLEQHMKCHKDVFTCRECDLPLETEEELEEHLRTHFTEKSTKCMVCDVLFRASDLFTCNLTSSSDEPPFQCLLCETCFNDNIVNADNETSPN